MSKLAKGDWSDPERVTNMAESYADRYGDAYWTAVDELVGIGKRSNIADFGCGPGMLLLDASRRFEPDHVYGFDASEEMLSFAGEVLGSEIPSSKFTLQKINFDEERIKIETTGLDVAFSGFMLHEVRDPMDFVHQVEAFLKKAGVFVVYDFVSGNEAAFVDAFMTRGWTEEKARKRYPHMCKHSIDDIEDYLTSAGLKVKSQRIREILGVVVGIEQ